jgi:hypothetical protein
MMTMVMNMVTATAMVAAMVMLEASLGLAM